MKSSRPRLNLWAEKLLAVLELKYPDAEADAGNVRRYKLMETKPEIIAGLLKAALTTLPHMFDRANIMYGQACGIMLARGMITGTELDAIERH